MRVIQILAANLIGCASVFAFADAACDAKAKTRDDILACTHFTDTFDSEDHAYTDKDSGARIYAPNHPELAISDADNITGYIATFDNEIS